jgi:hypothetical protein
VTFDIDANGIVNVSAKDKATGKEEQIRIQDSGGLTYRDIQRAKEELRCYALSDRKRREVLELCNEADTALLRAEELMKAHITEVALAEGDELDDAMRQLRAAMRGNDSVAITRKIAALTEASVRLDEFLRKATVTRAAHLSQADKPDQHVCATPDYSEPKTAEVIDTGGPHPQESSARQTSSVMKLPTSLCREMPNVKRKKVRARNRKMTSKTWQDLRPSRRNPLKMLIF